MNVGSIVGQDDAENMETGANEVKDKCVISLELSNEN